LPAIGIAGRNARLVGAELADRRAALRRFRRRTAILARQFGRAFAQRIVAGGGALFVGGQEIGGDQATRIEELGYFVVASFQPPLVSTLVEDFKPGFERTVLTDDLGMVVRSHVTLA
jgi:hypothetical protein